MNTEATRSRKTLAQADLFLLLARLLDHPSAARRRALAIDDQDLNPLIRSALPDAGPGGADILKRLRRVVAEARIFDPQSWVAEHSRLFDGPILCAPNETAYVRRDKGAILADICGFYTAFGFRLSDRTGEKADHLISEIEFLALLLVMLAQARNRSSATDAEVALGALRTFASEHLDEWLPLFVERLETTTALPLYRDTARVLGAAWEAFLAAHEVPRATREACGPPEAEPGTPYECSMAEQQQAAGLLSIQDGPPRPA